MVLDDTVVHHRNLRNPPGKMRMGVALGGGAMGGPAGVGNSYFTLKTLLLRQLAEFRNPTCGTQAVMWPNCAVMVIVS